MASENYDTEANGDTVEEANGDAAEEENEERNDAEILEQNMGALQQYLQTLGIADFPPGGLRAVLEATLERQDALEEAIAHLSEDEHEEHHHHDDGDLANGHGDDRGGRFEEDSIVFGNYDSDEDGPAADQVSLAGSLAPIQIEDNNGDGEE